MAALLAEQLKTTVFTKKNPRAIVEDLRQLTLHPANEQVYITLLSALRQLKSQKSEGEENKAISAIYAYVSGLLANGLIDESSAIAAMHALSRADCRDAALPPRQLAALQIYAELATAFPEADPSPDAALLLSSVLSTSTQSAAESTAALIASHPAGLLPLLDGLAPNLYAPSPHDVTQAGAPAAASSGACVPPAALPGVGAALVSAMAGKGSGGSAKRARQLGLSAAPGAFRALETLSGTSLQPHSLLAAHLRFGLTSRDGNVSRCAAACLLRASLRALGHGGHADRARHAEQTAVYNHAQLKSAMQGPDAATDSSTAAAAGASVGFLGGIISRNPFHRSSAASSSVAGGIGQEGGAKGGAAASAAGGSAVYGGGASQPLPPSGAQGMGGMAGSKPIPPLDAHKLREMVSDCKPGVGTDTAWPAFLSSDGVAASASPQAHTALLATLLAAPGLCVVDTATCISFLRTCAVLSVHEGTDEGMSSQHDAAARARGAAAGADVSDASQPSTQTRRQHAPSYSALFEAEGVASSEASSMCWDPLRACQGEGGCTGETSATGAVVPRHVPAAFTRLQRLDEGHASNACYNMLVHALHSGDGRLAVRLEAVRLLAAGGLPRMFAVGASHAQSRQHRSTGPARDATAQAAHSDDRPVEGDEAASATAGKERGGVGARAGVGAGARAGLDPQQQAQQGRHTARICAIFDVCVSTVLATLHQAVERCDALVACSALKTACVLGAAVSAWEARVQHQVTRHVQTELSREHVNSSAASASASASSSGGAESTPVRPARYAGYRGKLGPPVYTPGNAHGAPPYPTAAMDAGRRCASVGLLSLWSHVARAMTALCELAARMVALADMTEARQGMTSVPKAAAAGETFAGNAHLVRLALAVVSWCTPSLAHAIPPTGLAGAHGTGLNGSLPDDVERSTAFLQRLTGLALTPSNPSHAQAGLQITHALFPNCTHGEPGKEWTNLQACATVSVALLADAPLRLDDDRLLSLWCAVSDRGVLYGSTGAGMHPLLACVTALPYQWLALQAGHASLPGLGATRGQSLLCSTGLDGSFGVSRDTLASFLAPIVWPPSHPAPALSSPALPAPAHRPSIASATASPAFGRYRSPSLAESDGGRSSRSLGTVGHVVIVPATMTAVHAEIERRIPHAIKKRRGSVTEIDADLGVTAAGLAFLDRFRTGQADVHVKLHASTGEDVDPGSTASPAGATRETALHGIHMLLGRLRGTAGRHALSSPSGAVEVLPPVQGVLAEGIVMQAMQAQLALVGTGSLAASRSVAVLRFQRAFLHSLAALSVSRSVLSHTNAARAVTLAHAAFQSARARSALFAMRARLGESLHMLASIGRHDPTPRARVRAVLAQALCTSTGYFAPWPSPPNIHPSLAIAAQAVSEGLNPAVVPLTLLAGPQGLYSASLSAIGSSAAVAPAAGSSASSSSASAGGPVSITAMMRAQACSIPAHSPSHAPYKPFVSASAVSARKPLLTLDSAAGVTALTRSAAGLAGSGVRAVTQQEDHEGLALTLLYSTMAARLAQGEHAALGRNDRVALSTPATFTPVSLVQSVAVKLPVQSTKTGRAGVHARRRRHPAALLAVKAALL